MCVCVCVCVCMCVCVCVGVGVLKCETSAQTSDYKGPSDLTKF